MLVQRVWCRLADRVVTTNPIAGTRPRGIDEELIPAFANDLIQRSCKHRMLADLGENDISGSKWVRRCESNMEVEFFLACQPDQCGWCYYFLTSPLRLWRQPQLGPLGAPGHSSHEANLWGRKENVSVYGAIGYLSVTGILLLRFETMILKKCKKGLCAGRSRERLWSDRWKWIPRNRY